MTKDWDPLRDEIQQLYQVENRKLLEVMRIIQGRHDFKASERSYRTQMRKWGYMKYSTQDFPKPNRRSRPSTRHLKSSSGEKRTVAASGITFAQAFSARPVSTIPELSQPNTSDPSYLYSGHAFTTSNTTPQSFSHVGQPHATWPISAASQHGSVDGNRGSDLHLAVLGQDEQEVRRLLYVGFSVDDVDSAGNQPLHYAAKGTSATIVNHLIRYGANVNAKGELGQSPLHLAASNLAFTRYLLTAGANTEVQDENGDTPVHLAVINLAQASRTTDLHSSALYAMISKGCHLNIANLSGMTPFHGLITEDSHQEVISAAQIHCLQNGASPTLPHPDGRTPLEVVLSHYLRDSPSVWSKSVVIKTLIDKGADPQTRFLPESTLLSAYLKAVDRRDFGFDFENTILDLGKTLCTHANLIQRPNSEKSFGVSLLHMLARCCVRYYYLDIIPLFTIVLKRGADPNLQDEEGKTPFLTLFQTTRNNPETVLKAMELMIEHGGKALIPDFSGDNSVFAAGEFFRGSQSVQRSICVRRLLKSTLECPIEGSPAVEPDGDGLQGKCGWEDWNLAAGATDWNQAFKIIRDSQVPGSKTSAKILKKGALSVLAEWHVKAWDETLEDPDKVQRRRKHIAQIIHDCQNMDVLVDRRYYHELVELSL